MAAPYCSEMAEVRRWSGGNLPRTHPSYSHGRQARPRGMGGGLCPQRFV